jgi:hypothetical protein
MRLFANKKQFVVGAATILLIIAVGGLQTQYSFSTARQRGDHEHGDHENQQRFQYRATAAIQEPVGYTAACFASNLDSEIRTLSATIIDWRGNNVTATSSCGTNQGPGITCQSTATYSDSALRCVVGTNGSAAYLRGSLTTSAGPYPFTFGKPTNATVTAE